MPVHLADHHLEMQGTETGRTRRRSKLRILLHRLVLHRHICSTGSLQQQTNSHHRQALLHHICSTEALQYQSIFSLHQVLHLVRTRNLRAIMTGRRRSQTLHYSLLLLLQRTINPQPRTQIGQMPTVPAIGAVQILSVKPSIPARRRARLPARDKYPSYHPAYESLPN